MCWANGNTACSWGLQISSMSVGISCVSEDRSLRKGAASIKPFSSGQVPAGRNATFRQPCGTMCTCQHGRPLEGRPNSTRKDTEIARSSQRLGYIEEARSTAPNTHCENSVSRTQLSLPWHDVGNILVMFKHTQVLNEVQSHLHHSGGHSPVLRIADSCFVAPPHLLTASFVSLTSTPHWGAEHRLGRQCALSILARVPTQTEGDYNQWKRKQLVTQNVSLRLCHVSGVSVHPCSSLLTLPILEPTLPWKDRLSLTQPCNFSLSSMEVRILHTSLVLCPGSSSFDKALKAASQYSN